MKTIPSAHPPHHSDGFVVTCRLWTASGRVPALLVLELTLAFKQRPNLYSIDIETDEICQTKKKKDMVDSENQKQSLTHTFEQTCS